MILLSSHDRYDTWAEFEPLSGEYSLIRKPANKNLDAVQGRFSELGSHFICLYRIDDVLHLRVDNRDITLSFDTTIHLKSIEDNLNQLAVLHKGILVFEFVYKRPVPNPPLSMDPTPFVSEDDFDFGLYVYNIANDPERRARIFRGK